MNLQVRHFHSPRFSPGVNNDAGALQTMQSRPGVTSSLSFPEEESLALCFSGRVLDCSRSLYIDWCCWQLRSIDRESATLISQETVYSAAITVEITESKARQMFYAGSCGIRKG